ncbi:MAG: hypothetical protein ACTSO4_14715 [Promethearchaeota archaeon]
MKEKFIFSLFTNLSSNVLILISTYLLALNLNVNLLGIWVLLNSVVNLGFMFLDVGFDLLYYQYSGKKDVSEYIGTYFFLKIFLVIFNIITAFIIAVLIAMTLPTIQSWINEFLIYFSLLLISKILYSINNIFLVLLKGKIKVFKSNIPTFLNLIGKSLAILYLALNLATIPNPILFICISNLIFDALSLILVVVFSKNEFKINKPKKKLISLYLRDSKYLILSSIVMVISNNLGNILVDYFFGHETLAYFGLINTYIIPTLLLISGSFITIYTPLFSQYLEKNDYNSINFILYKIEKYLSIIYLIFIIIVFLNAKLIFSIALPNYLNSVFILYFLIFLPYIIGIARHYPYLLIAGKKQDLSANINSLRSFLTIILMLIFIPNQLFSIPLLGWGIYGYALAQIIPYIIWNYINRYYSFKYYRIHFQKKLILHALLAAIAIIICFPIKEFILKPIIINPFLQLIISLLVSVMVFLTLLFIFKQLNKEDLRFFKELFILKNYTFSLKEEFSNES